MGASGVRIPWPTHEGTHRAIGWFAAAALLVPALSMATTPTSARAAAPDVAEKEIAAATAGEFRVAFIARKADESAMPTATVEVAGFVRREGTWVSVGRRQVVPDKDAAWFWNTVTDPGGVCELSVADSPEPSAAVVLSYGPSAGCATTARFRIERGRLVDR
ncbi:hypothetical protein ABN028_15770 [Actinopolymorpha sp. B17G11]|uniref:hypothetical protein n=1 Tax=unclassified Actinopolymorpha TaxID=2627063 RepID=UPI0032D8FAA8